MFLSDRQRVLEIGLFQEIVQEKNNNSSYAHRSHWMCNAHVEVGPKSNLGIYDTELEITKDSY